MDVAEEADMSSPSRQMRSESRSSSMVEKSSPLAHRNTAVEVEVDGSAHRPAKRNGMDLKEKEKRKALGRHAQGRCELKELYTTKASPRYDIDFDILLHSYGNRVDIRLQRARPQVCIGRICHPKRRGQYGKSRMNTALGNGQDAACRHRDRDPLNTKALNPSHILPACNVFAILVYTIWQQHLLSRTKIQKLSSTRFRSLRASFSRLSISTKASTRTIIKTTSDPLPKEIQLQSHIPPRTRQNSQPTTIRQLMVLQDRVADLEQREFAFEDGITLPESDGSARTVPSTKKTILAVIALIEKSAVLGAPLVVFAVFGHIEDEAHYNATSNYMSPDQRLVLEILSWTYFVLWVICVLFNQNYQLIHHGFTRLFAFMAFIVVGNLKNLVRMSDLWKYCVIAPLCLSSIIGLLRRIEKAEACCCQADRTPFCTFYKVSRKDSHANKQIPAQSNPSVCPQNTNSHDLHDTISHPPHQDDDQVPSIGLLPEVAYKQYQFIRRLRIDVQGLALTKSATCSTIPSRRRLPPEPVEHRAMPAQIAGATSPKFRLRLQRIVPGSGGLGDLNVDCGIRRSIEAAWLAKAKDGGNRKGVLGNNESESSARDIVTVLVTFSDVVPTFLTEQRHPRVVADANEAMDRAAWGLSRECTIISRANDSKVPGGEIRCPQAAGCAPLVGVIAHGSQGLLGQIWPIGPTI
ncbi:uncharacterized protein MYCFIDRAFT_173940 [Pseudocercospora fijiensis CIRAD86]|uniref:Transmembrane protein n=1 Tax=Pseudocercospora fijiensis (strain CIRAD86) TaxID=383855 RepID=M2Z5H8_PSEFD|nr:uncharacterized protein MYCFIDRAFT_173940 [Pseudocercospora fijiensis CIRAD86]EME85075.1 hypothetical protein MYCFIDRAFT_173940 [Pseudocercospora fijiensis CIRAD86]